MLLIASCFSVSRVLTVDSSNDLLFLSSGIYDEVQLRANISIPADFIPVSFSGTINGYGNSITVNSPASTFQELLNVTMVNVTIVQESGYSHLGALASHATDLTMISCTTQLKITTTTPDIIPGVGGLVSTVDSLTLINCLVNISVDIANKGLIKNFGGLAQNCSMLTVIGCTVSVDLTVSGAQDNVMVFGGLASMGSSMHLANSSFTLIPTRVDIGSITIGGVVGSLTTENSTMSRVTITIPSGTIMASQINVFGGAIAKLFGNCSLVSCYTYIGPVVMNSKQMSAGGVVGQASGGNSTFSMKLSTIVLNSVALTVTSGVTISAIGGAAGWTASLFSFSECLFRASSSLMAAPNGSAAFGGATASSQASNGTDSFAIVTFNTTGGTALSMQLGGFFGILHVGGIVKNLVAHLETNTNFFDGAVGGIVGYLTGPIVACYARSTFNINTSVITQAGFMSAYGALVGQTMNNASIDSSHALLFSTGKGKATVGGLVGLCMNGTITDSFSLTYMVLELSNFSSAGGFIGYVNESIIRNCYTSSNLEATFVNKPSVGGFVGIWMYGGLALNTVVYGNLNITAMDARSNVGSFLGWNQFLCNLTNCFSAQAVYTPNPTLLLPFVFNGWSNVPATCQCAKFGNLLNCTDVNNFRSLTYFNTHGWNLTGTYSNKKGYAYDFIYLVTLPVLSSNNYSYYLDPTVDSPWNGNNWTISSTGTVVFNLSSNYACSVAAGCHGTVPSVGRVVCEKGWSGNKTSPCSTYTCTNSSDCNGGTCNAGVCTCAYSFTGQDCMQQPCGPNGAPVNGMCVCKSPEYFMSATGQCEQGCFGGCGHGTCVGLGQCICFAGYQSSIGNPCSLYMCNATQPQCFGVATCEENIALGGHWCKCPSKVEYFEMSNGVGKCVVGCPNLQTGQCIGPNVAHCKPGWTSTGNGVCNTYNCATDTSPNACGGAGTCNTSSSSCTCSQNAQQTAGGSCIYPNCVGIKHGKCHENKVTCNPGWESVNSGTCNKYNCAADTSGSPCGAAGSCNSDTGACTCASNAVAVGGGSCECKSGWYSNNGQCNMYNCTAAGPDNLCNGLGYCNSNGSCSCLPIAAPEHGTCQSVAGKCGPCASGTCRYDPSDSKARCVCLPETKAGDASCYKDDCGFCGNGQCSGNSATMSMTCSCASGYTMISNMCYKDSCTTCNHGACGPVDATLTIGCNCDKGYTLVDDTCYFGTCGLCKNGKCTAEKTLQTVMCICNDGVPAIDGVCILNSSNRVVEIVVPIVVISAMIIVVAVIIALVCRKKSRNAEEYHNPAPLRSFSDFSSVNTSFAQTPRQNQIRF